MDDRSGNEKLLDYIIQRVEKIDEKVDTILKFKWQIIGGAAVVSIFVTIAIQLASIFYSK